MARAPNKLTDKQELFCLYYVRCFNATKAYQKAYNCSYNTARVEGSKTLAKPNIKKKIKELKKEKLNRNLLTEDDIFQRFIDIAFADITDFVEFGSTEVQGEYGPYKISYVNIKDHTEVDGTLIAEVSQGKDGVKVKLQDKIKALQWLADRMDLLPTRERIRVENEKTKLDLMIAEANKAKNDNSVKIKIVKASERQ